MKKLLMLVIACFTLNACASRCTTFSMPKGKTSTTFYKRLKGDASRTIHVTMMKTRPMGALTQAIFEMHNMNTNTQNVSYEVLWFDKDGIQVNKQPNIVVDEIDAKARKQISVLSPTPEAITFDVTLCMLKE